MTLSPSKVRKLPIQEPEVLSYPEYFHHQEDDTIDLFDLFKTLWNWKWLIILIFIIGTSISYIVTIQMPKIYVSKHIFETNINDLIIKDLNNLQLVNKIEDQIINETNKKNYQNNFKVSDFTFEYEISNNNLIISFIVRSTYPELSYEISKNMPIYIYDNIVENSKNNSVAQISNFIVDEELTRDLFFEHQKFLREQKLYKLKIIEDELLPLKQLIIKKKADYVLANDNTYKLILMNEITELEKLIISTRESLVERFAEEVSIKPKFKIIDYPQLPKKHESPKTLLVLALTSVVSIFVGIFLVFVIEFIKNAKSRLKENEEGLSHV